MGIFHFFVKPYPVIRFLFGMKPSNGVKKKVAVANKVLTVKDPLTEVAI
jgi:hypothetical protein